MAAFRVRMPRTNTSSGRSLYEQSRAGFRDVLANVDAFVASLEEDVLPEVIKEALEPTLEISQGYVPKKTGRLHDSGYVEVTKRRGEVAAEIGYNRHGEAPYAIFVHEMPQFYHTPPTQYKYLQRALDEDEKNILGRIVEGVKRRTGV